MKKILFIIASVLMTIVCHAQDVDYTPVDEWPFAYEKFMYANITVGKKKVKARCNIHLKNSTLWFISDKDNKTKLEATPGSVNEVCFSNGDTYKPVENHLCKIVRQDTINGVPMALYQRQDIDMEDFKNVAQARRNQGTLTGLGVVAEDFSIGVATSLGGSSTNAVPLTIKNVFYIQKGDKDPFRFNESSVLKNLESKEERSAYKAFTRKAEIIYGNLSSAINAYTTFFLK